MPLPTPKAFWPLTIDAANRWIDFRIQPDAAWETYAAQIAEGVYLSPAELFAAVVAALTAEFDPARKTLISGRTLPFQVGGSTYSAALVAGTYSLDDLCEEVRRALEAALGNGWVVTYAGTPTPHLIISGSSAWIPRTDLEPVTSDWQWLGFPFPPPAAALTHNGAPLFPTRRPWTVAALPSGRVIVRSGYPESGDGPMGFELLFGTGAHAAESAAAVLGFEARDHTFPADATLADTNEWQIAGTHQHQNGWYAPDPVADDTGDLARWTRSQTRSHSGRVQGLQFGGATYDRYIALDFLSPHKVFKAEEGAHANEALERLIEEGWTRFRWWPDAADDETFADYALDVETARRMLRDRLSAGVALYSYPLRLLRLP